MRTIYKKTQVHYTDSGSGKTVVFLHGFLENSTMWNTLIEKLPKDKRYICIDLPGHGKTENLGHVHTMEAMADLIHSVLSDLKIQKAHFIGHSMGGYVTLALAEKYPNLFDGLCLMNSTFEADDNERKALRERANIIIESNFESMVRMSFSNLFALESKLKYKFEYEQALSEALKTSVQGYIAAQRGMMIRKDRFNVLKKLKAKKLIIIGKKDPVISGKGIKEKIEKTDIVCAEFSEGHMSHIENMYDLSYFILHFIE